MFDYTDRALNGYFKQSKVSVKDTLIGFDKVRGRDNLMYNLNDGYNLEEKETSFIEKLIEMNMVPNDRRISKTLQSVVGSQGNQQEYFTNNDRWISNRNPDSITSTINEYMNIAKFTKSYQSGQKVRSVSTQHSKKLTLEEKILLGHYYAKPYDNDDDSSMHD